MLEKAGKKKSGIFNSIFTKERGSVLYYKMEPYFHPLGRGANGAMDMAKLQTKKQEKRRQEEEAPRREIPLHHPDPERGLTLDQAKELLKNGYGNTPVESPTKSDQQIIKENVCTFFNLIFVVLAICLILVGEYRDMLFLVIAIANTLIGIVQQIRSKRVIEKLNLMAAPTVRVVREGVAMDLHTDKLVREDIVELTAGCQIPADGPVVSGQIQVNESLITGEADAITKQPGAPLLSGSFVVSGRCRARMDQVGADSYASKLTLAAKAEGGNARSEMMHSLDKLIRVVGILLIPIGLALFYNHHIVQELDIRQSVVATVAALTGMIPEGLYLLTSVALAVSVVRLAMNKTLIHDMNAIETLARVDVLCADKTGTITQPDMEVTEVVVLQDESNAEREVEDTLNAFYQAVEADNDTAKAMKKRFHKKSVWSAEHIVPFTSATKWSAVTFRGHGSYVVGAPDFILQEDYPALAPRVLPYQEQGCRVLLLARCEERPREGRKLEGLILPMALIVLKNPVRPEARDTFAYFAQQGVAIKVISGDDPHTVSQVARQAGIEGAERFVDATTLKDGDLTRALEQYTVFGRVTPDQKRKFVRALQRAGHTVAMTGDGVNDVLALKDADCGIAMASGSEAACQVAQLVLTDSNFASMPKVVAEGRRVINNIQRAAALYLVKNIFSLFLSLLSIWAVFPYPFTSTQISLVSAMTIGIPSFFLALEPNHDLVQGRFMHNVLRRAFPGGLTNLIMVLGVELFAYAFDFDLSSLSTMSTVLMGAIGLLVLYYISKPLDWKRWLLLGTMSVCMLVCMAGFGGSFGLSELHFRELLVMVVLLLLAPSVIATIEKLFELTAAALQLWGLKREKKGGKRVGQRKKPSRVVKR